MSAGDTLSRHSLIPTRNANLNKKVTINPQKRLLIPRLLFSPLCTPHPPAMPPRPTQHQERLCLRAVGMELQADPRLVQIAIEEALVK